MKKLSSVSRYVGFLVMGMFLSCGETMDESVQGMAPLNLQPPCIGPAASTRYSPIEGTSFPWKNTLGQWNTNYDKYYYYADHNIGFCIYEGNTPHLNGYDNLKRVLQSKKYWYPQVKYEQEWLEPINARIGHEIKVYAYYPWQAGSFTPEEMPFTTTGQKDWMWAEPVSLTINSENSLNRVPLTFHHAMTCLEIRLSTRYNSTIDLYQITLNDTQGQLIKKGWINLTNGAISPDGYASSITIKASADNGLDRLPIHNTSDDYLSYCFLIPEKTFTAGDLTLTFWYDSNKSPVRSRADFTVPVAYKKADNTDYQPTDGAGSPMLKRGERYILNLIIDNTTAIEALDIQADENWTDETIDLIVT